MPNIDTRLLKPFITDADDMYSFDDIAQMKNEITAIYGFDEKKILRVNRFTNGDIKGRLHWRYISQTQDATSVEIKINLSNNPKIKNEVTRYANICVGVPFLNDDGTALQYWDGTKYIELPTPLDIYGKFQDEDNERVVNWKRIPIMLENENELKALTDIKSGDKFIICNLPSNTSAGNVAMYFATNKPQSEFPKNEKITTATTGINVYKVSSFDTGKLSDGTPNITLGKLNIDDTSIVTGKALKFIQDNSVNTKDIQTVASQGGINKVASAEVVKKLSEKVDTTVNSRGVTLNKDGTIIKAICMQKSLFRKNINAGINEFTFTLDDTDSEAQVLNELKTYTIITGKSIGDSNWSIDFNYGTKKLKVKYTKGGMDSNTFITIEVHHKYLRIG